MYGLEEKPGEQWERRRRWTSVGKVSAKKKNFWFFVSAFLIWCVALSQLTFKNCETLCCTPEIYNVVYQLNTSVKETWTVYTCNSMSFIHFRCSILYNHIIMYLYILFNGDKWFSHFCYYNQCCHQHSYSHLIMLACKVFSEMYFWCRVAGVRIPWTARRSNQSILKEYSLDSQSWIFIGRTDAEAEAPILWSPDVIWIFIGWTDAEAKAPIPRSPDMKSRSIGKDPDAGKDWGQGEKGATEDEMVGWHHGHEFEQTPGDSEEQGSLACCSPWGHKESDMA